MAAKKPLSFNLDDTPPGLPASATTPKSRPEPAPNVERKQVGARIPVALYRKLKAHAALKGEAVQVTVEAAVADYLSRQTEGV
jgi:hypothetical protein